jgi:hypothetical protein
MEVDAGADPHARRRGSAIGPRRRSHSASQNPIMAKSPGSVAVGPSEVPWPLPVISLPVEVSPYRFFRVAGSRSTTSFALNFAISAINFSGTGSSSGKRTVPLPLSSYGARPFLNAVTSRSLAG